ncbi:hypothetical protein IID04_05375 [PVC group bacterium]|nr:hypothetical protein [PVC group bacterium]
MDFEKIEMANGQRLVFFGRFAGICGCVDALCYAGKRLAWLGDKNPFAMIKSMKDYKDLRSVKRDFIKCAQYLKRSPIPDLSPFIIGITGRGNVARGVMEMLDLFDPIDIHPRDLEQFIKEKRYTKKRIYRIVFTREEKFRSKKGHAFYFEDYLEHPRHYESRMDEYLKHVNILLHASYWDDRFPRLVTKRMLSKMYRPGFRLSFIGDLSCDINGAIEITSHVTTPDQPVFTYDPEKRKSVDGYQSKGISVMAIDNLPCELPKDSSEDFSLSIREYIYQIAVHGAVDVTEHAALPSELRRAVITQEGALTKRFQYLRRFIKRGSL